MVRSHFRVLDHLLSPRKSSNNSSTLSLRRKFWYVDKSHVVVEQGLPYYVLFCLVSHQLSMVENYWSSAYNYE